MKVAVSKNVERSVEEHICEGEIQQTTMILRYFEYEVPVLCLEDGEPYIHVVELCKMLGLRAEIHIPKWRQLVLWSNACKLPYHTPRRGTRMVWCLHMGALVFWFCCFNWSLVLPERRVQLEQAMDEGTKLLGQTHRKMQARYKTFRHQLFEFLTRYSGIDTTLPRFSASLHVYLNDFDVCIAWEDIISQGRRLIEAALKHAQDQKQDQANIPVIDAMRISTNGEVIEEFPLPLLPVIQEEDIAQFHENLRKVTEWHQQMTTFLAAHGVLWNEELKKWYVL